MHYATYDVVRKKEEDTMEGVTRNTARKSLKDCNTLIHSQLRTRYPSLNLMLRTKKGTRGSFLFLFFCKRRSPPLGVEAVAVMAQTMARHLARHLAAYLAHPKGIRMGCQRFEIRDSSTWLVAWRY
eukprot:scaffold5879_cov129-Chaetoceros_neogracile.AAC.1